MDDIVLYLHDNLLYLLIVATFLIFAKFAAGFVYFRGNVVDSVSSFFSFYSASNIGMTDSSGNKLMKRASNIGNLIIYVLLIALITFYYIHPTGMLDDN